MWQIWFSSVKLELIKKQDCIKLNTFTIVVIIGFSFEKNEILKAQKTSATNY